MKGFFKKRKVQVIVSMLALISVFSIIYTIYAYTPSKVVEGIDAFPQDYQPYLKELKSRHPNWNFYAVYTYLDWDYVVKNEMVEGRSLVSTRLPDSWKRDNYEVEPGWVNASKTAVEYSLDPRNFLTDEKIFQFEFSEFNEAVHTPQAVEEVLKGTDMYQNTQYVRNNNREDLGTTYASIIYEAGKKNNVSAVHMASRIIQENGGKVYTNKSINGSTPGYEGYYNFMNIGASCNDGCGKPYLHGLMYAKKQNPAWDHPRIAIDAAGKRLRDVWIAYGQNTVYFEKFDVNYVAGAWGLFSNQYMTNITAPSTESTMMYQAYKNTNQLDHGFNFYIPVYSNMPHSEGAWVEDDTLVYLDDPSDHGVPDTFTLREGPSSESAKIATFTFQDDNKVSDNTPYVVVRKKLYTNSLYDYVEIYDRNQAKVYNGYMYKEYIYEYPEDKLGDKVAPKIEFSYAYNKDNNTVKVTANSNEVLKNNKPTWDFGADRKTYVKEYSANGTYHTTFSDEFNNIAEVEIKVTQIDDVPPKVSVTYTKNDDKTVTVTMKSNEPLTHNKTTWTLSEDKKTYTRVFDYNTSYITDVVDVYGNVAKVELKVVDVEANVQISSVYDSTLDIVTVNAYCEKGFKETKPTWKLSSDKKIYTKVYNANGTYTTPFEDVSGNIANVRFEVKDIRSNFIIEKQYQEWDNTVVVTAISKVGFVDTKPTWKLNEDGTRYTKVYNTNGTYITPFEDKNGVVEDVTISVQEVDDKGPEIKIVKQYDPQNEIVTVKAISNEEMANTKPTWKLSESAKEYTKVYDKNGVYTTTFEDKYGNVSQVTFEVNELKSKFHVVINYQEQTNSVMVKVTSNVGFKETKPTWKLSPDEKEYTKVFTTNQTYATPFEDKDGVIEDVVISIQEIDDKGPEIKIEKQYDAQSNTVTVKAISNEVMGNTKPTWRLSESAKEYTKVYTANGTYTTPFEDKFGNETPVTFTVTGIKSTCSMTKQYDPWTNTVTVTVTSNIGFKETKPTWKLSEDGKQYSKVYTSNGTYATPFEDIVGNIHQIDSIEINEIHQIYITETGTRYHYDGTCNGGKYFLTDLSLTQLREKGYTPCQKCVL